MIRTDMQVRLNTWLLVLLGVCLLSVCGKAADTGATDTAPATPTISIALLRSSDGVATTSISSAVPGTVKVNIRIV